MNIDLPMILEASAGAITGGSGLYAWYRHIRYGIKDKKDRERQAILSKANEELDKVEAKLEEKIRLLQEELRAHKDNLDKDMTHMREIYDGELKNLGNKIDDLRKDLSDQHSSMVALLTRLVETR